MADAGGAAEQVGGLRGAANTVVSAAGGPVGIALGAFSLVSSLLGGKKAEQRLKDARIVQLGPLGTSGEQLGIAFGRCQAIGFGAYAAINEDIPIVTSAGTGGVRKVFGSLGVKDDKKREKSLLMQDVISVGEIEDVQAVLVNGKVLGPIPPGSGLTAFKADVARIEFMDFEVASPTATAFTGGDEPGGDRHGNRSMERDANSIFTGKSYATALHFLTTDLDEEVVYSGKNYPEKEYIVLGQRVHTVNAGGTLSATKTYSNNLIYVLLWFLSNPYWGPTREGVLTADSFDYASFRKAAELCALKTKNTNTDLDGDSLSDEYLIEVIGQEAFDNLDDMGKADLKQAILKGQELTRGGINLNGYSAINTVVDHFGYYTGNHDLIKHEVNAYLPTDRSLQETMELLSQACPGLELYRRIADDKIGVSVPDGYTPEADQVVRTFTKDDVLDNSLNITAPNASNSLVNQLTMRYRNEEIFNEEDTITFPKDGSEWFKQLLVEDGEKFHQEVSPFGVTNEYAAKAWMATRILMSHRYVYSWQVPQWDDENLDVSPGDVVKLFIDDPRSPIDRYIRLSSVYEVVRSNGYRAVQLVGLHFVRTDYQYYIDTDEPIRDLNAFSTSNLDPLTGIAATTRILPAGSYATVTLEDDNSNLMTAGFQIQIKSNEVGSTWEEWGTINSPDILSLTLATPPGSYRFQARKVGLYHNTTTWLETQADLVVYGSYLSLYVIDKTVDSLTIGVYRTPDPVPTSYTFTIALASDPQTILETITANHSDDLAVVFDGLKAGTRYRVVGTPTILGQAGPADALIATTNFEVGYEVIGISRTHVKATVPDQGGGITYEWEYDIGRLNATQTLWLPLGTTTVPTITATGKGMRGNQTVNVRVRWYATGMKPGTVGANWVFVGTARLLQHADAPGLSTGLTIAVDDEGVFQLDWTLAPSIHPIVRHGCRLVRDGIVAEFLGQNDQTTTRTTFPQLHSGNYYFEVNAISEDTGGERYYGDVVRSDTVEFPGQSVEAVSKKFAVEIVNGEGRYVRPARTVRVRAVGESIPEAEEFYPSQITESFQFEHEGNISLAEVTLTVDKDGVKAALGGADADDFEVTVT